MKKMIRFILEWKTWACLMFTGAMTVYLVFSFFYGNQQAPTLVLWGFLWMSFAGSLLQALCFSTWFIKKLRYTWRTLLFVLLFFPLMALIAWKAEWVPAGQAGVWAIFTGVFFLIFILMSLGFELYFQMAGRKYEGLIGQYRKEKESAGADGRNPCEPRE